MPSKEKKRELYIAGSMAELQKKSEVKPTSNNARILVKSADTMFREAEKFDGQGDEERAFIMYMRYFNIVKQVKMNADYKKNKQYYDNLIGQKNQVRAIEQAEQLADSLKERYDFKEAEAVAKKFAALEASGKRGEADKEVKTVDKKPGVEARGTVVDVAVPKDQVPSTSDDVQVSQLSVTPTALYNLLRDPNMQLLLMDTRAAADFAESHLNHPSCISVPQDVLPPGTSVTRIESQLPQESQSLWKQRGNVDHIVLLDWSSQLDSLTVGTTLRTLKDALFTYDSTVIIKSEPLVLEGGYDQWLLFYPTMTTNARVTRPRAPPSSSSSSISLLDFDYPDFEEPETVKAPSPDRPPDSTDTQNAPGQNEASDTPGTVPRFNRALKPKAPGMTFTDSMAKTSDLNNTHNRNSVRDTASGENLSILSNNLYPSVAMAKKPEKNTNVAVANRKLSEDSSQPEPPAPALLEEVQMARLRELEAKRKKEEKALADIMRKRRHVEQDLRQTEKLAEEEKRAQEARDRTLMEEDAERKRLAEVDRLRQERMRKELEAAQRQKERQDNLAKEKAMLEAREKAERDEQEARLAAQRAADAEELRRQQEEQTRKERKLAQEQEVQEKQKAERAKEEAEASEKERAEKAERERKAEAERADREKAQREKAERADREKAQREKAEKAERERAEKEKAEKEREETSGKVELEKGAREGKDKPSAAGSIRQAQEPKSIPAPTLPSGWEKRLDSSTRRYYYIDHNRGKTQWEPPSIAKQPQQKGTYVTRLKEEPIVSSTRGLSRSHSSPDIMKQLADEARDSTLPAFDRTSKPAARPPENVSARQTAAVARFTARRRDLNPLYGNVGPALTGLRNLGNTCYMNSTIQCLNNTTPLITYFLNDNFQRDINRDSVQGMHGEVVDEFAVVVKALWSGQYRCITPRDLKSTVGKYNPMFAGFQQQDSQEFLTFLLDGLHEGLNEVKVRPQIADQENDKLPDIDAARRAWADHKRLHRSIIVELFQGQLKSTLMCRTCGRKSVTFQAFMYISLPIPASSRCTLRDCFRAFLQPEMMTGSCKWKCPQCRVERDAEKKIDIWKLPHILLIGLNRFVSDGMWMQKKTTHVDFPINDLDLQDFTLGPTDRARYSLYGVSNHYGTMEGGHYTAFCRNPCNSKWHKFDDHEVYEMSSSDVKTSAAFVLYYTSIPLNAPQFKPQL